MLRISSSYIGAVLSSSSSINDAQRILTRALRHRRVVAAIGGVVNMFRLKSSILVIVIATFPLQVCAAGRRNSIVFAERLLHRVFCFSI